MKDGLWKYNLLLHFTVFLFGFTGILGKLISISGIELVWYRILIALVTLMGFIVLGKASFKLNVKEVLKLFGVGVIVALHWVAFFGSIKITNNVSIALACLSSGTLFAAILEPIFFKTNISILEIFIGIVIIGAILLIIKVEYKYLWGIIIGLVSAFLSSLFTVFNKKLSNRYHPTTMSFYELLGGFIVVSIFLLFTKPQAMNFQLSSRDWLWLGILGTICTAFAFWATNKVLSRLSAYNVVLAVNLEPIYTFLLAAWIFNEHKELTGTFYLGASLILLSVAVYSYLKYIRYKNNIDKKKLNAETHIP
jgi:drug/metabolite transporter (DMT)-like permease